MQINIIDLIDVYNSDIKKHFKNIIRSANLNIDFNFVKKLFIYFNVINIS